MGGHALEFALDHAGARDRPPLEAAPVMQTLRAFEVPDVPAGAGVQRRRPILDPHATDWDPFVLWSEDWFTRGAFSWHPHKGFETVTLVLEGHLEHKDSFGGNAVMGPGDVQWTTAGRGILHSEEPVDGQVKALQLWLNLPAAHKDAPPRHQEFTPDEAATYQDGGVEATVFGGRLGDTVGPAEQYHETLFATLRVTGPGALPVRGRVGCLYVLEGVVSVDGVPVAAGEAVRLAVPCRVDGDGRAVVVASEPLREPVVLHFPFVLSREDEVEGALAEFRAGVHGTIW